MIEFVNDMFYGFGVGVWMCNGMCVYWMGCEVEVGCVWINCYYLYFVYVVFGGYK